MVGAQHTEFEQGWIYSVQKVSIEQDKVFCHGLFECYMRGTKRACRWS